MDAAYHHYALKFCTEVRRTTPKLFEQQMWCWGRDIRAATGNLLLDYGFTRLHPTHDSRLSTCYRYLSYPQQHITLWGFGMIFSTTEDRAEPDRQHPVGLYLRRQGFNPMLAMNVTLTLDQWSDEPLHRRPETLSECLLIRQLLVQMATWIAAYETWLMKRDGGRQRQAALAAWKRKPSVPAECMASAWCSLAEQLHETEITPSLTMPLPTITPTLTMSKGYTSR